MTTPLIGGVSELADGYRGFVLDVWGVLHEGGAVFPGALDALSRLRQMGKRVVLLSNAPRRAARVAATLKDKGLGEAFYDGLVTSGEATRRALARRERLGADVINMSVQTSAIKKGETLIDTAMTLNAMHPDVIVVRHPDSGAVRLLADHVNCSVINAGDGSHEHPTQALLDALTIRRRRGRIAGLLIAICGDILHSRVARSNMLLLARMGAKVRLVAPPTLLPAAIDQVYTVEVHHDMRQGLKDCDIVMMLRLQTERMQGSFVPSTREYFHFYGLDYDKLSVAKPDALIMHPGPMNRGVEIDSAVADDITRSIILDQVELGVAVRQACLDALSRNLPWAGANA
ncbi:MAG TPA: aspartate carbamoyltransferase catalytic subunit [Alphaproteobacteria bacterium]|nr:aspartate carbamoyltransferase catalytic subunit [Alphaproteobacteria bacterium]